VSNWLEMADALQDVTRETFGEVVVYTPVSTGVPETIEAPFDDKWQLVDIVGSQPVITTVPMLGVKLSDLSLPPRKDDTFTVRGTAYRVRKVELDGQGAARLFAVEQ
jgi:hypothetical protein